MCHLYCELLRSFYKSASPQYWQKPGLSLRWSGISDNLDYETISCSTFTFSAQVFEFVLFPSRERPGHPSAQLQQHQGDCPGSSICEALALSAGNICSVMSRLLQCQLFLTNLTLLEEEGGGFPEAFHVSVMRTSFLKRSRITITHLQAC